MKKRKRKNKKAKQMQKKKSPKMAKQKSRQMEKKTTLKKVLQAVKKIGQTFFIIVKIWDWV